jgi:hypothetical protein
MALSWDERRGLFAGSPDRFVFRKGYLAVIFFVFLFWLLVASCFRTLAAQEPTRFEIAVDTAGISPVAPNVYVTWIFAQESPKHHPVSGIIVAFDCTNRKVKRLAQVKYELQKDGSIGGAIQEVDRPWQDVTWPRMFELVCTVGATRPFSVVEPTTPEDRRIARPRNPIYDA